MFNQLNSRERGFTLIEMSIVLIIIGLIIGGILKGQELIESSRQKNLQSQIDGIRSAYNSFQDRFRAIPGDYAQASTRINTLLTGGNNNGYINTYAAGNLLTQLVALTVGQASGENVEFFNHMIGANLLGGASMTNSTQPTGYNGGGITSPVPPAAYPRSGLSAVYGTHEGQTAQGTPITGIWLRVHTWAGTAAPTSANAVFSPERMFQYDTKFDDGTPGTGRVRTDFQTVTANACGTLALNTYIATNTVPGCIPYIAIE